MAEQSHSPADDGKIEGPEGKGAPSAESHYLVTERDGVTRVDIADDALFRPGPGQGQPEAETD